MAQQGGANAPYSRFRGPVLVGQSSDFGIAAVNGGSTAPLISFWNASEHGLYVVSSAQTKYTGPGGDILAFTSAGMKVGVATSFHSTATGSQQYLYIPQTTASMTSAAAPPVLNNGAALVFAHANSTGTGRLWVWSSISGWMASSIGMSTTEAV